MLNVWDNATGRRSDAVAVLSAEFILSVDLPRFRCVCFRF
jgi:hypothetical protein